MDNSFQPPHSDSDIQMQSPHGLSAASLHIFESFLTRLTDLIQLTETEQNDAGIYFGDPTANFYQQSQDSDNKEQHNGQ